MSLKSSILLITVFLISCNSVNDNNDLVFKGTDINGIEFNSKEYNELWNFTKIVAKGMRKVIECERISIVVMGLDVPHAHIHLIPFNNINDIDFSKPKLKISNK